jgi:hypothetical protein
MRLSRLTEPGIVKLRQALESLGQGTTDSLPADLLTDPELVEQVRPAIDIAYRPFASRLEIGSYLYSVLAPLRNEIDYDVGVWAWLSVFYNEQLCPRNSRGSRNPGEIARWIPAVENGRKYYRHLLAGPYRIIAANSDNLERVKLLLVGQIDKPGEVVEQVTGRNEIISNPNALNAATALYFDEAAQGIKRGAAGNGAGSVRRFGVILNQYDVTWDLFGMEAGEIVRRLPAEFDRFRT